MQQNAAILPSFHCSPSQCAMKPKFLFPVLFASPFVLVLFGILYVILTYKPIPTAKMLLTMEFEDCTAKFETSLYQSEAPILSTAGLDNYSNETETSPGCDIQEIEYAFHTQGSTPTSKIEFDLGEAGEVTAFVSLNPKQRSIEPFVMGEEIGFRRVQVQVTNPQNQVLAQGVAQTRSN